MLEDSPELCIELSACRKVPAFAQLGYLSQSVQEMSCRTNML
jgi:hypothetical protein